LPKSYYSSHVESYGSHFGHFYLVCEATVTCDLSLIVNLALEVPLLTYLLTL